MLTYFLLRSNSPLLIDPGEISGTGYSYILNELFKLPAEICKKMRTTISNYWWGSSADNRHIHWQRWDHLTQPKSCGGMGFRDLPLFNVAMLGKQGWRLLTHPDSLCARVMKGRYYPHTDFMLATRKKHSSHTWRAILAGREDLKKGLIRRVGNGTTTKI